MKSNTPIPKKGQAAEALLSQLEALKEKDINWRGGRNFAYVYYAGEETLEAVRAAYNMFFSENALNPSAFPSLKRLEREVVQMTADLFHGSAQACGSITSGGTESILMAVKSAREWARKHKPEIAIPEIVLANSAHPAFHKACHYFGIRARVVEVDKDYLASPKGFETAINANTIMLVASAPSYPHGLVDPVEKIATLAQSNGLLCHVDACVGGFILPFLKMEGYPIPAFDFSVAGVTSISADIHKYGYAAKGASLIIYNQEELHKSQFYVYSDWSGGIYASPSIQGTRPGGSIAAAWMALHYLGLEGYRKLARKSMETALLFRKIAKETAGIEVIGKPDCTIFALTSDDSDIYELGDELSQFGWYMDRQQLPPSLHFTITPAHATLVDQWQTDLETASAKARKGNLQKLGKKAQIGLIRGMKKSLPKSWMSRLQQWAGQRLSVESGGRQAAMYGMIGELQGEGDLDELVKTMLFRMINEENA
ncbi:MAG: aspartate aminotransferase family protein [Bacteroidetes bacterium]|nr:aspartate aminotransferase family protein [Bacteroidota bacterium]